MPLLERLRHPIVLAPLGGGPSTPELAAAVSEAGGLGLLAAGYLTAEAARETVLRTRALTGAAFGVNLFAPPVDTPDAAALAAYLARLEREARRHGAPVGEPRRDDDDWDAKLAMLAEERVPVVSVTFGCPSPDEVDALHRAGAELWVTVTDPDEARRARDAGADALVVQGIEAGGHRGGWSDRGVAEGFGLLALLRLVAAEVDTPLVATGGIPDGAAVAAVLVAGAAAAQLGSAFMLAPEAGTHPSQRAALRAGRPTALTRAFTGRRARGLRNRFLDEHSEAAVSGYPEIHHATAPLRTAARAAGNAEGFNLWAGQAHSLASDRPAGEIVARLAEDARAALAR